MTVRPLILLVEDSPPDQLLVRNVLEHAEFQVDIARTASDARRRLALIAPALILMDIQLPGEDGLRLTRQLASMPHTASIPVVALTAHDSADLRDAALAAGCVGFIAKPISVKTFPSEIAGFIAASKRG